MKVVEENNEKIFTKNRGKGIIKKKYNPLNKDKGFYERMGLYMKKEKDGVLNEITKELNYVERIIVRIFFKTFVKVYNKTRIDIINKMLK